MTLNQVEQIFVKTPGKQSLFDLLKVASGDLEESDIDGIVDDRKKYEKYFKKIRAKVHPDRHSEDMQRATNIFQRLDSFYKESIQVVARENRIPSDFSMYKQWPFLSIPAESQVATELNLYVKVACQCINARGCIVHGRQTELFQRIQIPCESVEDVFQGYGGYKCLKTNQDIKRELMRNGPVVSTSFVLTDVVERKVGTGSFVRSLISKKYPILITGWVLTSQGEMWIVQLLNGVTLYYALGQSGIDDKCIAPTNFCENLPWQHGPYFDLSVDSMNVALSSNYFTITSDELEKFAAKCFDGGFLLRKIGRKTFVLREKNKIARSWRCYVTDLEWKVTAKMWSVGVTFC